MLHILRKISRNALAVVALLGAGSAQAALVNFQFSGTVDYSAGYGGLVAGNTVTVTGVFDDSALTAGSGTIDFTGNSGNTLSIAAGTYTFTQANDSLFAPSAGASLTLTSGALFDFNYGAIAGVNGALADFGSFFGSFESNVVLSGTWSPTVQMTPVPVPAALWLFGSGLLGLAGVVRRRRRA